MNYLFLCVVVLGIGFGINYGIDEYKFRQLPVSVVECTLLNHNYSASTRQMRAAPVIGSNGNISTVVYSTGDFEKNITVWDCGEFGRLVSHDKTIYRLAKEKTVLLIRSNDYDTRIVGIE